MNVFVYIYGSCRGKRHGAGPGSRRMALTLALSAWAISTRRPWVQSIIYRRLPIWMKTSWVERSVNREEKFPRS